MSFIEAGDCVGEVYVPETGLVSNRWRSRAATASRSRWCDTTASLGRSWWRRRD